MQCYAFTSETYCRIALLHAILYPWFYIISFFLSILEIALKFRGYFENFPIILYPLQKLCFDLVSFQYLPIAHFEESAWDRYLCVSWSPQVSAFCYVSLMCMVKAICFSEPVKYLAFFMACYRRIFCGNESFLCFCYIFQSFWGNFLHIFILLHMGRWE